MSPRWGALCYLNLLGFILLFDFVLSGPVPRTAVQYATGLFLFFVLGAPLLPFLQLLGAPMLLLPAAILVNAFVWASGVEWILRSFVDQRLNSKE